MTKRKKYFKKDRNCDNCAWFDANSQHMGFCSCHYSDHHQHIINLEHPACKKWLDVDTILPIA